MKKNQSRVVPLFFLIAFSFFAMHASAQVVLNGTVVDADTQEPLAFVTIQAKGSSEGTITNIDGKYTLNLRQADGGQVIVLSSVGYQSMTYSVSALAQLKKVKLKFIATALQEVVINSGANPAHAIVKKAIAAKPTNDPASLNSYSFNCYNKTVYTASGLDSDSLKADSIIEKTLRYGHLAVMESYTNIKRMQPHFSKEVVLKNKVSGWEDAKLAFLSSSFQPFAFYDEQINLFGTLYINPLSDGSLKRYEFYLVDTLIANQDTTYVMSFEPIRKIEHKTLKGVLSINTDRYAIENVIAYPADSTMKIDFRIQQKYERVQGHWFPKELYTRYLSKESGITIKNDSAKNKRNTVLDGAKDKVRFIPLVLKNQSYFSNIAINPALDKTEFGNVNVDYREHELKQTDWKELRPDMLSGREVQTYFNYDTLNEKTKKLIAKTANLSMNLASGTLPIGKVSILPDYLMRLNRYEKVALGIGLSTNDAFSNRIQLQGYGMYGFADEALKYGAMATFHISKPKAIALHVRYNQNIVEPGYVDYVKSSGLDLSSSGDVLRKFIATRMDSVQQFSLDVNFKPLRFTQLSIFSNHEERNPTYTYSLGENGSNQNYVTSELGLNFRFLFKETVTKIGNLQVITGSSFPYVTARVSQAFAGVAGGEFDFTRADIRIKHVMNSIAFGKTTLYGNVSKVWGSSIPYSYLNFSNAFKFENTTLSVYAPGYFQTMRLYEFTSDAYAQLTIEQNTGPLFTAFKGKCQPELVLVQQAAYGSLRNRDAQQSVEIKTLEKGYFESGLLLNNLVRFNAKLYWLGYGLGVFYRYGPNTLPNQKDNFAFTLSSSIKL